MSNQKKLKTQNEVKPIPNKKFVVTNVILISIMSALIVYWMIALGQDAFILAMILFGIFTILFGVDAYQAFATLKLEHKDEIKKIMKENADNLEKTRIDIQNQEYRRRSRELKELEKSRDSLSDYNERLKAENKALKEYKKKLREIYMSCSPNSNVRTYAELCLTQDKLVEDRMVLFDPLKYVGNSAYSKTMDIHANELLDDIRHSTDILKIDEIQRKINAWLKNNNATLPKDSAPVLIRERKTLPNIDKGEER